MPDFDLPLVPGNSRRTTIDVIECSSTARRLRLMRSAMNTLLQHSRITRWCIALTANGLITAMTYTPLRSIYFTPQGWLIDTLFLVLVSTAHFWYMRSRSLSFKILAAVVCAFTNTVVMFWVAVALGYSP
jgi:hypothetical protein